MLTRSSSGLVRRVPRIVGSTKRHILVGPIDPVSNLRPVIYDDAPSLPPTINTNIRHPYSLFEFVPATVLHEDDLELQYKLQRQQLDAFHQTFWTDSNLRFEAGKAAILSSLPESSTPLDKERTLSDFYTQWLMQEGPRTDTYTTEWRKRLVRCMALGIRVHIHRFKSRFASAPKSD
ncbi:hypothetical protein CCMSSC00406_0003154 [Pleurotus cornucopiae]|uniref:Uncharacterized protein n=1 Tax=Pleurotus cornucopiae TaxID=5321 RepID=A0ACB7J8E4_PLECO|nr:hypothetical protein CCMSSC00406_0003154 [Pleurotus cornucopiae]